MKPTLKFDTAGLDFNKAEEFTFHWWDHVYNKAATNITVHKDQVGVIYKNTVILGYDYKKQKVAKTIMMIL